jgi:selenide,water dikinase
VDRVLQDVLFDPQTSGGLIICVAPQKAEDLLKALKAKGIGSAAIVGEVIAEPKERIKVE